MCEFLSLAFSEVSANLDPFTVGFESDQPLTGLWYRNPRTTRIKMKRKALLRLHQINPQFCFAERDAFPVHCMTAKIYESRRYREHLQHRKHHHHPSTLHHEIRRDKKR